MSSANDRLTSIREDLEMKKSQWEVSVVSPYVRAYDFAYNNYQNTLKAQVARDKMGAELLVFTAGVLSGSVLMAAFASSSLRVLAGRALLRTICNNNLNRTFDAVHAVTNNKAAMFALGSVLDKAKGIAGQHITAAVENFTVRTSGIQSQTSVNFLTRLQDFVNVSFIAVHEFVTGVRSDNSIKESDKLKLADMVEATPFWLPPRANRVDENKLAQQMELLFYMTSVLDSDTLVRHAPSIGNGIGGGIGEGIRSKERISQMPTAKDYPKESEPKLIRGATYEPGQRVEYDDLGSVVRARIDTLSRAVTGSPFYPQQSVAMRITGNDPTGREQMVKAEHIISRLSAQTRPKQLSDVFMM
ncbi:hypothetical protein [Allorhizobium terrae]|uniref:Uncharacterized protein n=1 Tax=Allorhizobium terrae TaxID=1848972 RepID=A0A4S3ZQJ5_9HYPH|nr:hypothetical protein [Allorhizobium terrae]THF47770.1 hypothetical protein E6C51_17025 [Allorhizobium terrae]